MTIINSCSVNMYHTIVYLSNAERLVTNKTPQQIVRLCVWLSHSNISTRKYQAVNTHVTGIREKEEKTQKCVMNTWRHKKIWRRDEIRITSEIKQFHNNIATLLRQGIAIPLNIQVVLSGQQLFINVLKTCSSKVEATRRQISAAEAIYLSHHALLSVTDAVHTLCQCQHSLCTQTSRLHWKPPVSSLLKPHTNNCKVIS